MAFGVFMHRADSNYDDLPAERYQFPANYLRRAETMAGDWVVYLEPRRVPGTRGYFAIARVQRIIPDPAAPGLYLAIIEPGSYLDFASPVPFADAEGLVERGLLNAEGKLSGRAQAAVRPISATDFNRILERGLNPAAAPLPRTDQADVAAGLGDAAAPYEFDQPRERVRQLTSRIVRDRVFRSLVLRAYNERCAVTGLRLINGGGRAEVAAAHIRPVEAHGPDIISNGLALSGTSHWMFDRGLISLGDDYEILISRQVNDPVGVRAFINRDGKALVPTRPLERPHPRFLQWHRENCFKH